MAFVKIPKDLTAIKTKVAFNLTKRQLICFGIVGALAIPTFIFSKAALGMTTAGFLAFLVGAPFFMAGMYARNGQPFEKVMKNVLNTFFLRPKKRPFVSQNYYAYLVKQYELDEEIRAIKNEGKTPKNKYDNGSIPETNSGISFEEKKAIMDTFNQPNDSEEIIITDPEKEYSEQEEIKVGS